jgi:WW domain-containing oxidoreductase
MAKNIGWLVTKTVEQGAATQTYVATNPALVGVRGYYFKDCNPAQGSRYLSDDALAKRLWDVSAEITRDYLPPRSL